MAEYRKGFCVEMVTSGCKCQPLSVYESAHMGDEDFHNMTEGVVLHGIGGDLDNQGVCPKCQHPVRYNRYLVVTQVPPKKPTLAAAAPDLLAACEELLIYLGDWDDMENETCVAARKAIAKAKGGE